MQGKQSHVKSMKTTKINVEKVNVIKCERISNRTAFAQSYRLETVYPEYTATHQFRPLWKGRATEIMRIKNKQKIHKQLQLQHTMMYVKHGI